MTRRILLCIFLLSVGSFCCASKTRSSDWCVAVVQSIAQQQQYSPERKIQEWKSYEKQCGHNGSYQRWLADLYISYGFYDRALLFIEKEVKVASYDSKQLKMFLMGLYIYYDEPKKMKALLDSMLVNHPNWYGSYHMQGLYYQYTNNLVSAESSLKKASEMDPSQTVCLLLLCAVAYELDKPQHVIDYFDAALKIDKFAAFCDVDAASATASALVRKGRMLEAKNILEAQMLLNSEARESHSFNKAKEYYEIELSKLKIGESRSQEARIQQEKDSQC